MKIVDKQFSALNFRHILFNSGLSVRQLALELTRKLDDVDGYIDLTRIYRWRNGDAEPDKLIVLHMAKIFDLPMADFYEEKENENDSPEQEKERE